MYFPSFGGNYDLRVVFVVNLVDSGINEQFSSTFFSNLNQSRVEMGSVNDPPPLTLC